MRLYILDFGLFQVYENNRVIGIPGFLIRSGAATILVDTGFPPAYADDAQAASRADDLGAFGRVLRLTHEQLPAGQLARVGLTPADVTHLVLTHTHIDHVGGLHAIPNAEVVIGRAERALSRPLYFGARQPLAWPPHARYRLVDGDEALLPGVTLLATPGHSPGHLSLLLDLPHTGATLLTADAISRPDELADDRFDGAWNPALARASAQRLMAIARQRHAWIIYGHDPTQWPELRKAPDWYD